MMTAIYPVPQAKVDGYEQLVRELRIEFDYGDVGALADRIVAAEAADFYWEARVRERYLGHCCGLDFAGDDCGEEVVRVAMLSFFGGRWHAGACLVDGEGNAVELLWRQSFEGREPAETAFMRAV